MSIIPGSTFIQWKKGFELAKGEFVWIAETDDYSDPNFLEESIKMLRAHPSVVIVYSQSIIVDENEAVIRHNLGYTSHLDEQNGFQIRQWWDGGDQRGLGGTSVQSQM